MSAHEFVNKVEFSAFEEVKAGFIDNNVSTVSGEAVIIGILCGVELELVLEAIAAASQDRNA
ncbi:hypothetical protein AA106556_0917 [Neokomagataea tanensis NBRC 106556]|uniref:Uncharacterized protein n=1 Tax=Neokomagataea tanensis NBRC 106556 TaxID=1223519 RepID=A0ABQ0QIE1_9PROT|nr:hypothetical protein AA106556_0917 [Neokomagataea tanensis NBRC 106556]